MRTSLLPALLDAARRNIARGVADVGLFEVGPVVWRAPDAKEPPDEPTYAAAILVGRRAGLAQAGRARRLLRRQAASPSSCCGGSGVTSSRFAPLRDGLLHPGAGAAIHIDGREAPVGMVGRGPPARGPRARPRGAGGLLRGDARRARGRAAADPTARRRRASRRSRATSRSGSTWRSRPASSGRCCRGGRSRCCATWPCSRTTAIRDMCRPARRGCSGR